MPKTEKVVLSAIRKDDGSVEVQEEDRVVHGTAPVAFRCKQCGRLERGEHAGDNAVPHACAVCGAGILLSPKLKALATEMGNPATTAQRRTELVQEMLKLAQSGEAKHADPNNWEVLADADEPRLKELGLEKAQVVKHHGKLKVEAGVPIAGKHLTAEAEDGIKTVDKAG